MNRLLLLTPLLLLLGCPEIFGDDETVPDAGPRDIGEECDVDSDCRAGLECAQRSCQPLPPPPDDAGPDAGS